MTQNYIKTVVKLNALFNNSSINVKLGGGGGGGGRYGLALAFSEESLMKIPSMEGGGGSNQVTIPSFWVIYFHSKSFTSHIPEESKTLDQFTNFMSIVLYHVLLQKNAIKT